MELCPTFCLQFDTYSKIETHVVAGAVARVFKGGPLCFWVEMNDFLKNAKTHITSGQIIATHLKWWFRKGIPFISGKSRLVKYYDLAR